MKMKYKKHEMENKEAKASDQAAENYINNKKMLEKSLLQIPKILENDENEDKIEIGMEEDEYQIMKNKEKEYCNINVNISEIRTDGTVSTTLSSSSLFSSDMPTPSSTTTSSTTSSTSSPDIGNVAVVATTEKGSEKRIEKCLEKDREDNDFDNDTIERMERTDSNEDLNFSLPCSLTIASEISSKNEKQNESVNDVDDIDNNFFSSSLSSPLRSINQDIGGWGDIHHEKSFPAVDEKPIFTANPMGEKKMKNKIENKRNESDQKEKKDFYQDEKVFLTENPFKNYSVGKKKKSIIIS